jgi:protein-tyrosine phosphatase/membrane-associated phospholipid phosphatase
VGDLQRVAGAARPSLIAKAATSAGLSALFLVAYSTTNWITSQRSDVGTWYVEWELAIPFVPLMIIPYMSIDLFFVAAPFLCGDRREMTTLAKRISFAILAAGVCFLLMPLHLVHQKPEVGGWLGAIFDAFLGFDKPYNLFPSLHITLRTILADLHARHTRGLTRAALHVWFSLIGVSTVLTYQHHLVDIAGGFVLAAICFYLFRAAPLRLPVTENRRVGIYYAVGTLAAMALAASAWPWSGFFLWPAVGLGLVTAAYFGLGPGVYRKSDGLLPLSSRLILWPLLLGQKLSLVYYRRQCRAWDEVCPRVLLGRRLTDAEAAEAVRRGVTGVLDLTAEFSEAAPFLRTSYRHLPILDLTAPTIDQLREAAEFIAAEASRGTVYVHCKIGYSRSAAAVGAYLLASGQAATAEEAVERLHRARPAIIVRPEAMAALRAFARTCSAAFSAAKRLERRDSSLRSE